MKIYHCICCNSTFDEWHITKEGWIECPECGLTYGYKKKKKSFLKKLIKLILQK